MTKSCYQLFVGMFRELSIQAATSHIDLVDLAIMEAVSEGLSGLKDIASNINRFDTQIIHTRLKKLEKMGLVTSIKYPETDCSRKNRNLTIVGRQKLKALSLLASRE